MRRLTAGAFGAVLALGALFGEAGAAAAQDEGPIRLEDRGPQAAERSQPRSCRQVRPSDFRRLVNTRGQEIIYFRDPVRFLCTGDVRLEADSAIVNRTASTVELVGRVVYQDSIRELNADWANYLGRVDQLLARGSTVVRDLEGGTVVRGDRLNFMRETATRPTSLMIVTGGRPHAVIPPSAAGEDTARATTDTARVTTEIRADRMEFRGEDVFEAEGSVDLQRGEMVGGGREAQFDQRAGQMTLTGAAFIEGEAYRLDGERIDAHIEEDQVREVHAEESARVTSEEVSVAAERVRIGFAAGELESLEAWNPDTAAAPRRARADAEDFHLRADSIHARADSVGIREIRAVGRAYGERDVPVDSAVARAGAVAAGPTDRDWIQGDTIHGFFEHVPADRPSQVRRVPLEMEIDQPETEEAVEREAMEAEVVEPDEPEEPGVAPEETQVVLERIVVIGGSAPALSLYRMTSEETPDRPSINFMKATRIVLFMARGELDRVEAEGPIEGIYLEPGGQPTGAGGEEGQE